jgi:PPK2 family polyphosphate:nucleotide phosphotransferase
MIHLDDKSTLPPNGIEKKFAQAATVRYKKQLFSLQNVLFAEQKHSVLIILQGMDAAGKDGTIRHVFSSMNPMGVNIKAFKAPTDDENNHDFLWRIHPHTPAKGMIEIFNRSHYEDILVPVVHKTLDKKVLTKRYDSINNFEQHLLDSGTIIMKFFLHVSKKEQEIRLKERLHIAHKKWKYDPADSREFTHRDMYLKTYEKIFDLCGNHIPWHIVPSDKKWYRNYFIARELRNTLVALDMKYPS